MLEQAARETKPSQKARSIEKMKISKAALPLLSAPAICWGIILL